jgi:hypothetical protein
MSRWRAMRATFSTTSKPRLEAVQADAFFPISSPACTALEIATVQRISGRLIAAGLATEADLAEHPNNVATPRGRWSRTCRREAGSATATVRFRETSRSRRRHECAARCPRSGLCVPVVEATSQGRQRPAGRTRLSRRAGLSRRLAVLATSGGADRVPTEELRCR